MKKAKWLLLHSFRRYKRLLESIMLFHNAPREEVEIAPGVLAAAAAVVVVAAAEAVAAAQ